MSPVCALVGCQVAAPLLTSCLTIFYLSICIWVQVFRWTSLPYQKCMWGSVLPWDQLVRLHVLLYLISNQYFGLCTFINCSLRFLPKAVFFFFLSRYNSLVIFQSLNLQLYINWCFLYMRLSDIENELYCRQCFFFLVFWLIFPIFQILILNFLRGLYLANK